MKKTLCTLLLGTTFAHAMAVTPLWMRDVRISPDGKEIVFCYKGDIYKVSAKGGEAVQLTTQDSYESSPVWSPDGKQIAFASDRFGNTDVFVMPANGGSARRLTTNSASEIPSAFTPDGKFIVFSASIQDPASSALFPTSAMTELYKVSAEGGKTEQILGTPAEMVCFNAAGDKFLYQDRKGFIWIATENGLNKFDGTRFSIYRHNATDSTSLKNNYVRTLFEDSRGNFWIGCINGLQRYDRATDNFHELFISRKDGRKNPHITSIIERRNGDLWIATSGQGAISLKKNSNPASFHIETELTDRIGSNYLNVIFEDSRQNLWIATEEKGLYRYSPENKELKSYKAPYHIAGDDVSAICEDAHGQIFVGTLTKGLFRLSSRQEGNFEPVLYQNRMNLNIRTLIIDTRGKLIIGTDGEGVKEYQPQQDIIVDSEINAGPFDFSKSKVHSLIEDKDHNLWLGIFQKGLILVPGISNKFDYYGYKSIHNNTIGSSCVMAIHTDEQATIWIGTDNDGL